MTADFGQIDQKTQNPKTPKPQNPWGKYDLILKQMSSSLYLAVVIIIKILAENMIATQ